MSDVPTRLRFRRASWPPMIPRARFCSQKLAFGRRICSQRSTGSAGRRVKKRALDVTSTTAISPACYILYVDHIKSSLIKQEVLSLYKHTRHGIAKHIVFQLRRNVERATGCKGCSSSLRLRSGISQAIILKASGRPLLRRADYRAACYNTAQTLTQENTFIATS
jgi:hypothetical protein